MSTTQADSEYRMLYIKAPDNQILRNETCDPAISYLEWVPRFSVTIFFSFFLTPSCPIPCYIRRFWGELEIGNSLRHVSARVREEGAYMPPTTP